ncbi:hypothetical protein [Neolewinella antarctica]|uniref:Transcription regulator BetR N-terminal domain-containing protein n=1 Tax=Neolewinella antarctica TaxID=442734 RepID=A0ABX0XAG8_9BACT|nr:hypothetical protein [Neolewinella antarctica]NJC25818.1 hypothetical protein [Neolewinella antarctica]
MSFNHIDQQREFFLRVESLFASKAKMVAAVGEALGIGSNAVYRRVKGDTVLPAAEMLHLAGLYHLDLNLFQGFERDGQTIYETNTPDDLSSEVDFFRIMSERMEFFMLLTDRQCRMVTPELPLSYEMTQPTLRAFKIYTYGVTSWDFKKWADLPFSPELIHPDTWQHVDNYVRMCFDLPSVQFLSPGMVDITLSQIIYFVELGKLKDTKLVDSLFDELHALVNHVEQMANHRLRYLIGDVVDDTRPQFNIRKNEIPSNKSLILLTSLERSIALIPDLHPNVLTTVSKEVIHKSEQWFKLLAEKSTLLGPGAGKQTHRFFRDVHRRINAAQEQLLKRRINLAHFI